MLHGNIFSKPIYFNQHKDASYMLHPALLSDINFALQLDEQINILL